jgi:hypothetical protein
VLCNTARQELLRQVWEGDDAWWCNQSKGQVDADYQQQQTNRQQNKLKQVQAAVLPDENEAKNLSNSKGIAITNDGTALEAVVVPIMRKPINK